MIYDAIIVGGGPAGATAALRLARAGWAVALVEKSSFPRRKVCGEFISATSLPLLRNLGVDQYFCAHAGPEIRRVGIFAGNSTIVAPMPAPRRGTHLWGRALGRERLDTLLLQRVTDAGVTVWQPWAVTALKQGSEGVSCEMVQRQSPQRSELRATVVVVAQGSWEPGLLPELQPLPPAAGDLFGFKAHFEDADLPPDLMTLLAFPGGYGGMVRTDAGRVSLSCCVRRDALQSCRERAPGRRAGEVVLAHIMTHCRGVREALQSARVQGAWLAAGPIRPGRRALRCGRAWLTGNAAGEAHPVIAEGISLAMQSAWLLAQCLIEHRAAILSGEMAAADRQYANAWRRHFAGRIRRSAIYAQMAMRPNITAALLPLLRRFPSLLTLFTRASGKTHLLPLPENAGVFLTA